MSESGPTFIPKGFRFSAVRAGIKASGNPDLALVLADSGTSAAALFTTNLIVAAPVEVGRKALAKSRGRVRAVVVNSGNANCATGNTGVHACNLVCQEAARLLDIGPAEVFPCSTGIIGVPLAAQKVCSHLQPLISNAGPTQEHLHSFAEAILTTDKRPKLASVSLRSGKASITGIAKGSGMIHPQLATMLVYLLTDVSATPVELKAGLKNACSDTFNTVSVDGDTSTNDTVLLLASGRSGIVLKSIGKEFARGLHKVCSSLAEQIIADGEGVQHIIRLRIEQARTRAEGLQVARTIAHSLLVKTAWAGADPNWGRILAAVGRSGVKLNPAKISIRIADQTVCHNGTGVSFDEQRAHAELSKSQALVTVRLGSGNAAIDFLTADLTQEYVRINADYST
jgi:glutamate N-acetyltransferase / amino-acid N-acetyltransferase